MNYKYYNRSVSLLMMQLMWIEKRRGMTQAEQRLYNELDSQVNQGKPDYAVIKKKLIVQRGLIERLTSTCHQWWADASVDMRWQLTDAVNSIQESIEDLDSLLVEVYDVSK